MTDHHDKLRAASADEWDEAWGDAVTRAGDDVGPITAEVIGENAAGVAALFEHVRALEKRVAELESEGTDD